MSGRSTYVPTLYYDTAADDTESDRTTVWSGTTAPDMLNNDRDMTFNRAVTTITDGSKKYVAVDQNVYGSVPTMAVDYATTGWTVEFVINITGYSTVYPFICDVGVWPIHTNGSQIYMWDGSRSHFDINVSRNKWYHVILQSNGTCYLNGSSRKVAAPPAIPSTRTTYKPTLGAANKTFTGFIAMLRVYEEVIDGVAAAANYNAYKTAFSLTP